MRGLNEGRSAQDESEVRAPVFNGPADRPAIGVVAGGCGTEGIVQALHATGHHRVALVEGLAASALAECEVLILTERRRPASLTKRNCWLIWEWVEQGGRLLLTHDAVGYRDHPILFPWVCSGGTANVDRRSVCVVWVPEGQTPIGEITHAYPDHILLKPCLRAATTVIAVDPESEQAVVSGAQFERGRVVACGLAIGVAADGSDSPPEAGERLLLEAMVDWLLM